MFFWGTDARKRGRLAAKCPGAASHPRLLADYEDGRVEGGGSTAASQRAQGGWGAVALDGG